jgi:hypothetical protein
LRPSEKKLREDPGNPGQKKVRLGGLLNFAVANARRTDANAASGAVDQRAHRLQIHVPAAFRNIMGVADSIAELRALSTNFANLCHTGNLLMIQNKDYTSHNLFPATVF